jgi:hypothetical protein
MIGSDTVLELKRFDEQQFKNALPRFEKIVRSYRSRLGATKAMK